NPGDPVVRIIKLDRLRVEAHVDGKKFGRDLEGYSVRLQVTLPPGDRVEEFLGKIVFVSPEVQPVTGEVRVWAEVENPQFRLRPGDHGALTIFLPGKPPETASVQVQMD
ncbi:MAG: efflux RND transporter periplasmic adaptor subunit, partial [Planctomycetota bacterium]|nr:efflux RND transporter periplasmic adaptor subunit [Planctomycetota bacterium]